MKRLCSFLAGLSVTILLSSCSSNVYLNPHQVLSDSSPTSTRRHTFSEAPGRSILSYTTVDGVRREFQGRAWVESDSMVFKPDEHEMRTRRVAMTDIASIEVREPSTGRTFALAIAVVAAVAGIALAVVAIGDSIVL